MTRKRTKKRKEEDTEEKYLKEIRQLKALNRSLLKRLKKFDKEYHRALEEAEDSSKEDELPIPNKTPCTHCGKGSLEEVNIVGRIFIKCSTCDFKGRKK